MKTTIKEEVEPLPIFISSTHPLHINYIRYNVKSKFNHQS